MKQRPLHSAHGNIHWVIIVGLFIIAVILGVSMMWQKQELEGIKERLSAKIPEQGAVTDLAKNCTDSGGSYAKQKCTCPANAPELASDGICVDAFGLAGGKLGQEMRAQQNRILQQGAAAVAPTVKNKVFTSKDVSFEYPGTWNLTQTQPGWSLSVGSKEQAAIRCPTPETGWEGWVPSEKQERMYSRNGKTYTAALWILKPAADSDFRDWLILSFARGEEGTYGGLGCMVEFNVADPPTDLERATAEALYRSIK